MRPEGYGFGPCDHSLSDNIPTVRADDLSDDEVGFFRRKVDRQVSDVLWRAEAAGWRGQGDRRAHGVGNRLGHGGVDVPGGDGVDVHAVDDRLARDRPREAHDPGFGRAVMRRTSAAGYATDRS